MSLFHLIHVIPGKLEMTGVTSRVSLARNLEGIPFPASASSIWIDDLKQRLEKIYQHYLAPKKYRFVQLDAISHQSLEDFFFQNLIPRGVLENPSGRFLIYSKNRGILVNYHDHISVFSAVAGFDLDCVYRDVEKLDNLVEQNLDYAFRSDWGYLTSSPERLGTGMDVSLYIHLPALSLLYGEDRFTQWLRDKEFHVKNCQNENGIIGHIYHFSNRFTLGFSEWQILDSLKKFGMTLIKWEKQVRCTLKNSQTRRMELEENVMMKGKQLFRSDNHTMKDVFDFLSLWALAWQCGIFSPLQGLNFIEVKKILNKIWGTNLSFKRECLYILRFFRVISGEDLYDV